MTWSDCLTELNDGVMAAFAETVTLHLFTGDVEVSAVYSEPVEYTSFQGMPVVRNEYSLEILTSDIADLDLNNGDKATVRGVMFDVIRIDSADGISQIELRKTA
ncbi:MAG: hypothetical protein VKL39_24045 [Leptolyngbyaceae bacterium]|nr:hypothetical protein [Leptolyngbyaceae bacterium]